jgi:hypothetical protein
MKKNITFAAKEEAMREGRGRAALDHITRGHDDETMKALKETAKQEGASFNASLVKILRKEPGIEKNDILSRIMTSTTSQVPGIRKT